MADPRLIAALRERIARRKARVKRPKRVQAARYPRAAEMSYERQLRDFAKDAGRVVAEHVFPILDREGDGVVAGVPLADLTRALEKARADLEGLVAGARRHPVGLLAKVEAFNRAAMNSQYKGAIGLEPFQAPARVRVDGVLYPILVGSGYKRLDAKPDTVQEVLSRRLRENVDLITSIPAEMLDQVDTLLRSDFPKGLRVEVIQKHLRERFDVAESRAALIARDQVGKLNAQLTESRNVSMGVTRYEWQTSGDERVRGNPSGLWPKGLHFDLNGKIFSYSDPPVTNEDGDRNHPGEDYQCRCNQIPQLEDALAALGV